tara:strand:- start:1542 stop:1787 length:246 start_codon:yes stop_codon:yes gene_type:complete
MNKANEEQFNELHNLVTNEFLNRVRNGEATTQDLKAACDWFKANDISGVAYDGNPLDKLNNLIPKVNPESVKKRLYKHVNI